MKINYLTKAIATIGLAGSLALSGCTKVETPKVQTEKGIVESENVLDFRNDCSIDEFYDEENQFCSNVKISDLELVKAKEEKKEWITYERYKSELEKICVKKIVSYDEIEFLYNTAMKVDSKRGSNPTFEEFAKGIEKKILAHYKEISEGKEQKITLSVDDLAFYILSQKKINEETPDSKKEIRAKEEILQKDIHELKDYLDTREEWKNKDYVRENKYWAVSFVSLKESITRITSDNLFYVNDVKIEDLKEKFPVQKRFPKIPGWATILFGALFPIARNIGLTYYLTGGKPKGSRMAGSVLGGIANGGLGILCLDGLHPLIYPIRNFVTPVVIQFFMKESYKLSQGENEWFT